MPYKRRKSNVNNSKEGDKRSYIIGYVKRASVAQLKELNKQFRIESRGEVLPKHFFNIQERFIGWVKDKDALSTRAINRIYDILPSSY